MRAEIIFTPDKKRYLLLLICILISINGFAQILVDSLRSATSTCENNGNIRVYAKSPNPPVLYSITAGPVTQPVQTGNIFNSLPPGLYSIRISDGLGNNITRNITIPGTYRPLEFNAITTDPVCRGDHNGKIVGNKTFGTGLAPFTWQLITPSPVTSTPQSSDTFDNLPAGNYTLRLTDACGSFTTKVVSLNDPAAINVSFVTPPQVELLKCDSAMVTVFLRTTDFRFPYTYTFETNNGTYTTTTPDYINITNGPNYFYIQHKIPDYTYSNFLRITVTDACGNSVVSNNLFSRSFTFCASTSNEFKNCIFKNILHYNINGPGCLANNVMYTYANAPLIYSYTDVATNTIVEEDTIERDPNMAWHNGISGITIKTNVPGNKWYKLTVKDRCGNTFVQSYYVTNPVTLPPVISSKAIEKVSCLDSTARISITTRNFKTIPHLIMLSGPATLKSTKPDYVYTDTYTYPDTMLPTGYGAGHPTFIYDINNLAPGKYKFLVRDSCGNQLLDSFTVAPSQVISLRHTLLYKKGCLGNNSIHYTFTGTSGRVYIANVNGGWSSIYKFYSNVYSGLIKDSLMNMPTGKYVVTIYYGESPGIRFNNTEPCQSITDTVDIMGYEIPFMYTSNSIMCQNTLHAELIPDSTKGVPPYQYEIISGPQAFPRQSSNIFTFTTAGTYTARIYDVCGNASTKQITVDTLSTPLLSSDLRATCNKARFTYPPSLYFNYQLKRPDHSIFTGDSLIIDPITPADTGIYVLTRITNINGCKDTSTASYHVGMLPTSFQNLTICQGDTTYIGANFYTTSGIYIDTLLSSKGCDSIVTLSLNVNPSPTIALGKDTSLCQGEQLTLQAAEGYQAYYWNNDRTDSLRHSIQVNTNGKFWLTIKNSDGCEASDTIEIVTIHSRPTVHATQDMTICRGESLTLFASGGDQYRWIPGGTTQSSLTVSPLATTTYSVIAYNSFGCSSLTEDIVVYVNPGPSDPVFSNSMIEHCFDEGPVTLRPNWGNKFSWSPSGDTSSYITTFEPGLYQVTVYNEHGCSMEGKITVHEYCPTKLFVPSAFSPNGDGQNDLLEIFGKHIGNFEIKIFNRWGEIIFISSDKSHQWDGKYLGEEMPIGTYPWIIHYSDEYDNSNTHTIKGSITIIR